MESFASYRYAITVGIDTLPGTHFLVMEIATAEKLISVRDIVL
ncbi:hypothetical protein N9N28_14225 [Rubripirellula amarantea]|uniref:Uncharacterized protein n=1 Tax=Rubripirellula amarantea TaxID=2527999 RepID=A0A5C5WW74_9BACT|nr:hypothetical protein [Rubripirellula amarantea]MDA8745785.1 hypothetical protein [Rubripirellula amarantea]TWT54828.1 hypothetical protein Pla22_24820 [Rubripirellula amarantea]